MMKTCKYVRAQRSTESFKFAEPATNSGNSIVAESTICDNPRRTFRVWVSLKKLGRNAVSPADAEKQLQQWIVRFKSWYWICTKSHPHAWRLNRQAAEHVKYVERQTAGKSLVYSLSRNPGSTRKSRSQLKPTDDIWQRNSTRLL
jgi:hypothetical protein